LILVDNGRRYYVTLRDVPLPADLAERYEAAVLAEETPDRSREFLDWWAEQCRMRELSRPRRTAEDIVHVRRLLDQHTYNELKTLALMFFRQFSEPLEEKRYAHHMRLFAHYLPDCRQLVARWENHEQ